MSKEEGISGDEALTGGEQELRLLVETIPTLVWKAGPGGDFQYVNKRVLEYVGAPLAEIMPTIDGFALQRLIREARPTLPVILVTGRHELAAAATEVDRGGRTLFEKPFDRDRLLTAINLELRESAGSK
jgi:DNA-binding LytR/AlgR family response regulator